MSPKARQLKNLFALDLGTTKFCLATVREGPGDLGIQVDVAGVPADGMRRGMVANIEQAKTALQKLLETAEKQFGADIGRVVVGIAGSHLGSRIATGSCPVSGEAVSGKDINTLVDKIEAANQREGREILHTVPIGFRVDQREAVEDPRGFRGKQLAGEFFLIDADRSYLKDVVELCNDSGLQVVRLYSEPFASASVTVPDSHKQLGVAVADIGGGTTDGIVFRSGRPLAAFTVNVAGKLMTSDLAIGLNVGPDVAEAVKIRFGIKPRPGDAMEVKDIRGQLRTVQGPHVNQVLLPRLHELCGLLAKSLMPFRGTLGAGLLLTGGGADVKGIAEYYQTRLNIPVARARPSMIGERAEAMHPTKHATVIGLLNLELCRLGDLQKVRKNTWTNRYLGQFMNWIKELS